MSFNNAYDETPLWEIGRPQQAFIKNLSYINNPVLDIGCGTGDNAIYLGSQGFSVTGIDTAPKAILKGMKKIKANGNTSNITFEVQDLFSLKPKQGSVVYNSIIDSGVFHIFNYEMRRKYEEVIYSILNSKGNLLILAFNELEPTDYGPPFRISKKDIYTTFSSNKWDVVDILDEKFEHNFDKGYALAYLSILRKK